MARAASSSCPSPLVVAQSGECQAADHGAPEVLGLGEEGGLGEQSGVVAGSESVESQMDVLVPGVVRVEPVGLADARQARVPGAAERQEAPRTRRGSTGGRGSARSRGSHSPGTGRCAPVRTPRPRGRSTRVHARGEGRAPRAPAAERWPGPRRGPVPTPGSPVTYSSEPQHRQQDDVLRVEVRGHAQVARRGLGVLWSCRCRGSGSRRASPRGQRGGGSPRGARWCRAAPPRGSRRLSRRSAAPGRPRRGIR